MQRANDGLLQPEDLLNQLVSTLLSEQKFNSKKLLSQNQILIKVVSQFTCSYNKLQHSML